MSAPVRQRWLILAHAFNMDGRAASQTITDKIPHLIAAGIEPVVLSGVQGRRDTVIEHHPLWPWGPAGIRFELRHVLRQHLSGWAYRLVMLLLSLPLLPLMLIEKWLWPLESSWSWRFAARHKGRALARAQRFDLIYSTGGAYAAHLAACDLHRELGIPWLAEVHDPFVTPGHTPVTAHERMKLEVERQICTHAQVAVWFTDQALAHARSRHPQLAERGHVLLPGIDNPFGDDLPPYTRGSKLVLGHFGSLSSTRTLVRVIEALETLAQQAPDVFADIELHVTGGPLDPVTRERLQASPVQSVLRHHGRIEADPVSGLSGRARILRMMRATDVLLLIHGEEPICEEYIPSKMYEYLWMRRPILAQVHRNPQMAGMLTELGHEVIETGLGEGDDTAARMAMALKALCMRWRDRGLADPSDGSPYTTQRAVARLLAAFPSR